MGLAGYIKPFLPKYVELPTLTRGDRVAFIDKEMRAGKGRWEVKVLDALNRYGRAPFKKRRFTSGGKKYEIDAAAPSTGTIDVGIDVKRIEAREDIHKRADEIVNKASKFKAEYPKGSFAAIIYYPYVSEHVNIRSRLTNSSVDGVMFASESIDSIETAAQLLLAQFDFMSGD